MLILRDYRTNADTHATGNILKCYGVLSMWNGSVLGYVWALTVENLNCNEHYISEILNLNQYLKFA